VISFEEAIELVSDEKEAQAMANILLSQALSRRSKDNKSIIVRCQLPFASGLAPN
jgi:serine/threonine protein phosphatase PrpC